MKIKPKSKSSQKELPKQNPGHQDLTKKFIELQKRHRNVYMIQFDDQVFFYKSLGRKDYKDIFQDKNLTDVQKEEVICEVCTVWPTDFDFENCDAGIPTVLSQEILKNSFLDSVKSRIEILHYYRGQMFDLENQISCIIHEAFPQFDIETIEAWDVERTTKYLSRAEWKLQNLRNIPFTDIGQAMEAYYQSIEQQESATPKTEEIQETNTRGGKKEKMTPEKLAQLKRDFPEIDWENDTILTEGPEAMQRVAFDTTPPALRPGY